MYSGQYLISRYQNLIPLIWDKACHFEPKMTFWAKNDISNQKWHFEPKLIFWAKNVKKDFSIKKKTFWAKNDISRLEWHSHLKTTFELKKDIWGRKGPHRAENEIWRNTNFLNKHKINSATEILCLILLE